MRNGGEMCPDGDLKTRIRPYSRDDVKQVVDMFTETVRRMNRADYTVQQLEAWAPIPPRYDRWEAKLGRQSSRVSVLEGKIVGIGTFEASGHLDLFYVHHQIQRRGVGRALYRHLESEMKFLGLDRVFTEASITARPFFERMGFRLIREQSVKIDGIILRNFAMEKTIP